MIVVGMELQMISLISSSGTGLAAVLLARVWSCIWCGASGVYWERSAMADGLGMSCAIILVES